MSDDLRVMAGFRRDGEKNIVTLRLVVAPTVLLEAREGGKGDEGRREEDGGKGWDEGLRERRKKGWWNRAIASRSANFIHFLG